MLVIVFSEKEVSANTSFELYNLAMISGKLGKTANGLISLKEKNNSQGLFDMGISPDSGVGGISVNDKVLNDKLKKIWGIEALPVSVNTNLYDLILKGKIKNLFIFGEDPIGCAIERNKIAGLFSKTEFMVVSDYFMTETAKSSRYNFTRFLPCRNRRNFYKYSEDYSEI